MRTIEAKSSLLQIPKGIESSLDFHKPESHPLPSSSSLILWPFFSFSTEGSPEPEDHDCMDLTTRSCPFILGHNLCLKLYRTQVHPIPGSYLPTKTLSGWWIFLMWPWCQKVNSTKPNVLSLLFQIIFISEYLHMVMWKFLFSCPQQLNRWPCHWLTNWVTFTFDITEWP